MLGNSDPLSQTFETQEAIIKGPILHLCWLSILEKVLAATKLTNSANQLTTLR
jgi:hypothetical protein